MAVKLLGEILHEIRLERSKQDNEWGEQNHDNGTDKSHYNKLTYFARIECERAREQANLTWAHILREEVYEALAEEEYKPLRAELLQVAAVCIAWIQCLDRKHSQSSIDRKHSQSSLDRKHSQPKGE